MKLVKINDDLSFQRRAANEDKYYCPRPGRRTNPYCNNVIIIENPQTKAALRTACRIIAADMYEKNRK